MVKIAAIGDNVVDCYLSEGQMFPGGNCLNLSVFIRRFGGDSAYVGAIGPDRAGDVIAGALQSEGVDVSHLHVLDGPTAYCVIGHKDGDRIFVTFDLGVSMFTPSLLDIIFVHGYDAVHVGQSSGLDHVLPQIAAGTKLSYDFSTRRDEAHRKAIAPLCFLASLSGGDMRPEEINEAAGQLLANGAAWVLVTQGRDGASLFSSDAQFRVAAAAADVVDTLGAGDTFIARTLYGLLNDEKPEDLLQAASLAAAHTCSYFGAVGHGAPIELGTDLAALRATLV